MPGAGTGRRSGRGPDEYLSVHESYPPGRQLHPFSHVHDEPADGYIREAQRI